ncbi:MAG: outer membrane protein assembly factor BamA [Nitrospirae bacterium]|nr:outer membrane protein assembly factor BamA [Nitrospirota bacterium]
MRLFFKSIFITIIILLSANVYAIDNPPVNFIEIKGVFRIEEGAIRAVLTQKIGEPLSKTKVADDIKAIFQMGYFRDVRVDTEFFEGGVKLTYILKEKPTIVSLIFHGNVEYDEVDLKKEITLMKGSIGDNALIQDNVSKLKNFYEGKGYHKIEVYPIIKYRSEQEVEVIFEIKENEKLKIREIVISGNEKISSSEIIDSMRSGVWWLGSFISDSGFVKDQDLKMDPERIVDLYYNYGYIDATATEPAVKVIEKVNDQLIIKHPDVPGHWVKENQEGYSLSVEVYEGLQYKLSTVTFSGTKAFPASDIQDLIKIKSGETFNKKTIGEDIRRITEYYTERGYALVSINPKVIPNKSTLTVSIEYAISEGKLYKIGRIEISGNTITRDKVIRREFLLDEGDIFNSKKLKRTYEKLMNLNFFEKVEISPKPHSEDNLIDLDVKVKEKSTGSFSLGGGYSSLESFMVFAKITKANLFGSGQIIQINAQVGGITTLYEITYQEPWFMDKPLSFNMSIFDTSMVYVDYTKSSAGFSAGFNKRFLDYYSTGIIYKFEDIDVFDMNSNASNWLKSFEGKSTTSSVTVNVERDSRDNFLDPTKGSRNAAFFTYAGLGGTNNFFKDGVDTSWFFPIAPTTFSLRGRFSYAAGINGEALPVFERYYIGGIYTIRGFDFGAAGPRDSQGTYIGGSTFVILSGEFVFPILPSVKLKGVTFLDSGSAYSSLNDINFNSFKYSTGGGIRWISPMGPIRIEYGYILHGKNPGESVGKVEFAIGGIL